MKANEFRTFFKEAGAVAVPSDDVGSLVVSGFTNAQLGRFEPNHLQVVA